MKREMKMMVLATVSCFALMMLGAVPASAQGDYCEPFNSKITKEPFITGSDGYLLYDGNNPVYTENPKDYAEFYFAGEIDPDDQQLMWGDLICYFPGGWIERVGIFDCNGEIAKSWGGATFQYFNDPKAKGHRVVQTIVIGETPKTYICKNDEEFFELIDVAKMSWFDNEPVVPLFRSTLPRVYTYERWNQDKVTKVPSSILESATSQQTFEAAKKQIVGEKKAR